ncbi:MAG: TRZ/ATZ family hydrolase [Gammaproteobacteria bacterium]|nr:TRZ/ATZ family hydrolase [Gammaproteobacteria bacterium]
MSTEHPAALEIIAPEWIIPVRPRGEVLTRHAVVVEKGRIGSIQPVEEAIAQHPEATLTRLPGQALLPGFVNAHGHAAMTLLRGLADDLPLHSWLNDHIWPAEGKWVSQEFVRDGVELAIVEMLAGGTTTFSDMYFFPGATAGAAQRLGIRAAIGIVVIEFPTAWADNPDEYIRKGLAVRDDFKSDDGLSFFFAPHAPYTVSDDSLQKLQGIANEIDLGIQMHVHETSGEVADAVAANGQRPLARLDELGLLAPNFMAVHMTALSEEEIDLVASRGAHVIHCPESNLKLASGFCPVAALQAAGVNVALGTDGAASNNDLDMLGELRTAAMLAKGVADTPTAVPAEVALEMATLNGAMALNMAQDVGSIEVGKRADLVAIDLSAPATTPVFNPISQVVYAASRDQVSNVWVGGRRRLENHRLVDIDVDGIMSRARQWRERIAAEDRS